MASCGSEKKAEEVYRATLNNKQKFRYSKQCQFRPFFLKKLKAHIFNRLK